jgi:hypothetical protein
MDGTAKLLPSLAAWTGMVVLYPVLRILPSDVMLQVYRKRENEG